MDPALHDAQRMERVWSAQRERQAMAYGQMTRPEPVESDQRSRNPMRPNNLAAVIGQTSAKVLLAAAVDAARRAGRPLDHILLVGQSGLGKSTFSHALANELGVRVYEVEAPVSHDTLMELREVMQDGDILRLEEIHQQGIAERRGRETSTQPEVLYSIMEDRTIVHATGVLPFPAITVIGTTTDEGRLPDAFVNRFPLRPVLVPYDVDDLILMAARNAYVMDRTIRRNAARLIAQASRGIPREVNNLIRVSALQPAEPIDQPAVQTTLALIGVTEDGLTRDMQAMLRFLYERGERIIRGERRYQASVNTIATGIGKSRDSKAVSLRVEPFLIEQGYVQVAHGGRLLTDAGVKRAKELCHA